jgi:catechol 2,3-dioxygenase-like lactoylglutathione lyase family enzyme
LNLERSISNLSKGIERLDSFDRSGNDQNRWRDKEIILLNDWIQLKGTPYALKYFPDDFDRFHTFLTEGQLKDGDEQTRKWYSDYLDLMEDKRNPNYGRTKCFHCLLSPDGDDPIFIGINRLVAKGLEEDRDDNKNNPIPYPCHVTNRFECPYEKAKGLATKFNVEDLFELANMAFAVEIALAVARKDSSAIQIKNKQDLYHALTNREMLDIVLEQGLDYILSDKETFDDVSKFEQLQRGKTDKIVDYFRTIKSKIKLEELRFY